MWYQVITNEISKIIVKGFSYDDQSTFLWIYTTSSSDMGTPAKYSSKKGVLQEKPLQRKCLYILNIFFIVKETALQGVKKPLIYSFFFK